MIGIGMGLTPGLGGGVPFAPLLFDRFITARAAGAIHGTAAEPGGSDAPNRVVSDTGNRASISDGVLKTASGGSTNTPNLTYNKSYARLAGLVLAAKCYMAQSLVAGGQLFGWSSTSNGTTYTHRFYVENQSLMVLNNGTGNYPAIVGKVAVDGPIFLAVVLRETGAFFFAFGGKDFGRMSLLRVHRALTTTPLYPAWTYYSSAVGQGVDDIVIPSDTYTPATLVSGLGVSGTINVADSGKTDVVAVAGLTRAAAEIGIITRYADANNYVRTYHNGTNVVIEKVIAGTPATVASVAKTYVAGADLEVIWQGTTIRVFYGANQLNNDGYTISDAALQTGTQVGVYSTNAGNSISTTFECFARGSGGEHAALKSMVVRPQDRQLIVFDGDSLTSGQGLTTPETYPYKVLDTEGRATFDGINLGVAGQTVADIAADVATQIWPQVGIWANHTYIIWAGTNDLANGGTAAATYTTLTSVIQGARAAGFGRIVVLNMIKRTTDAALETKRQAYNALIAANTAGADIIVDVGALPEFQDTTNTTYYQGDGTHITATGSTVIATAVSAAI